MQISLATIKQKKMKYPSLRVLVILTLSFTSVPCYAIQCLSEYDTRGNISISCSFNEVFVFVDSQLPPDRSQILVNLSVICYDQNRSEMYYVLRDKQFKEIREDFNLKSYWTGPLNFTINDDSRIISCEVSGCFDHDTSDYYNFPTKSAICIGPTTTVITQSSAITYMSSTTAYMAPTATTMIPTVETVEPPGSRSPGSSSHYYIAMLALPVTAAIIIKFCLMCYITHRRARIKKMRDIRLGLWIQNNGLEHNYAPINIKKLVISRSASFASTGFCQPKPVTDETSRDLKFSEEVKASNVDTDVDYISDGSISSHAIPLAYKDSNSFHDNEATESAAEVDTCRITEPQEIILTSNSYCDMNIVTADKDTTLSEEVNEDHCITKNEGYLSATSLVMDMVPLDIENHLYQLDSGGYVTKQYSLDFH